MSFWRDISLRGAFGDFREQWSQPQPYRWQILGIAVALTFAGMMLFIPKSERIPPERPTVTYITTFDEGRSQAQIIESNRANQARKEEAEKLRQERIEFRKKVFRELGRATGLDVDKMEREIAADEAAEAAAKQKVLDEIQARQAAAAAGKADEAGAAGTASGE